MAVADGKYCWDWNSVKWYSYTNENGQEKGVNCDKPLTVDWLGDEKNSVGVPKKLGESNSIYA